MRLKTVWNHKKLLFSALIMIILSGCAQVSENHTAPSASLQPGESTETELPMDNTESPLPSEEYVLFIGDFFNDVKDNYSNIPDVGSIIGCAAKKITIGGSYSTVSIRYDFPVSAESIENIGMHLESADFIRVNNVNSNLHFSEPPNPNDVVYLRGADLIFISLLPSDGFLTVNMCKSASSYPVNFETMESVEIDQSGGSGSEYTGVLFDGSLLDTIVNDYSGLPDPQSWNLYPAGEIMVETQNNRVTYYFSSEEYQDIEQTFREVMLSAGFSVNSEDETGVLYSNNGVIVALKQETGNYSLLPNQGYNEVVVYEKKAS